jgi:Uma2 family endonuclease
MSARSPYPPPGPYTADQIREGEPYELSNGHRIYCESGGGRHGSENATGALVLGSDPKVKEIGVDTGFSWEPKMLRAPDIAIGNVPNEPGWVKGVPELAVEYADKGQDEAELQKKIRELLEAGTRYLWVVRLVGPRRVEVFERGKAMRQLRPGELLTAPGVLKNPVPVDALYDRDAADWATLKNLLQRYGFEDLEAVLAEGEAKGMRKAVRDLCELLDIPVTPEREVALSAMQRDELDVLRERLKRDRRWE